MMLRQWVFDKALDVLHIDTAPKIPLINIDFLEILFGAP